MCFAHFHNRIADANLRMMDDSVRRLMNGYFLSGKRLLEKLDHSGSAARIEKRHQVWHTFRREVVAERGGQVPVITPHVLDRRAPLTVFHVRGRHY